MSDNVFIYDFNYLCLRYSSSVFSHSISNETFANTVYLWYPLLQNRMEPEQLR